MEKTALQKPAARKTVPLKALLLCVLLMPGLSLCAQSQASPDPSSLIGTTLADLYKNYGVPRQVYAVRGVETWQDDVVFVYDDIEFFIYGNRVWQIKVSVAHNVKNNDTRAAVERTLGEGRAFEGYTLYQLPGKTWPLMLRINWSASGRVTDLYIFRSDF